MDEIKEKVDWLGASIGNYGIYSQISTRLNINFFRRGLWHYERNGLNPCFDAIFSLLVRIFEGKVGLQDTF